MARRVTRSVTAATTLRLTSLDDDTLLQIAAVIDIQTLKSASVCCKRLATALRPRLAEVVLSVALERSLVFESYTPMAYGTNSAAPQPKAVLDLEDNRFLITCSKGVVLFREPNRSIRPPYAGFHDVFQGDTTDGIGLAAHGDMILVACYGQHCVRVVTRDGNTVRKLLRPELNLWRYAHSIHYTPRPVGAL